MTKSEADPGHARTIELLERAIRLNPTDSRAYNQLGQLLFSQKKLGKAVACFEQGVKVAPRDTALLNNLANALDLRGERERAIELYRRALEIDPRAITAAYNLANTLKDGIAPEEAFELFQRVLELRPDHVAATHDLGVLLERRGRFEEAVQRYEAVRKLRPGHVKSLANLFAIRSWRPDEATVEEARQLLVSSRLADEDRIKLHNGLAKHLDRSGRYDEAFEQFSAAKALARRRSGAFDAKAVADYFDRIIAAFPASRLAGRREGAADSQRPVFIVGMPRSGTTLTEQILASHPAVFGAGELQGVTEIVKGLRPDYPECVAAMSASQLGELARSCLASLESLAPVSAIRITDKLPVNFVHLGLIATLFPDARVIHCQRDPLDTALSCFTELFEMPRDFTTDLESFGQYYLQYERLMAHWRAVLPLPLHEQRYEDLVADPEKASRALVAHCGLPWDDACLDFQRAERSVATPSRWQVRQPIYSSSIGRWRHYTRHVAPLQRILGEHGHAQST